VGVDLAESLVGTTAPGVVAKTGQAVAVVAGEHFYESLSALHCAAAPIRDAQGRLAGVLDLSGEGSAFGFHAASMVGLYATRIENRLLQMQSREHLVVRFQADPSLLHTPLEGLAGVGPDGDVRWLNTVAARMLSAPDETPGSAQALFGLRLQELLALTRQAAPCMGRLPSGLGVWLTAQLQAPDGADFNHGLAMGPAPAPRAGRDEPSPGSEEAAPAPAAPAPVATLDDRSMQIIQATLAECGGNISRAARKLGVSRGLLYRRLRLASHPETEKSFHSGTGKSRG
jgi:transcriptional regulator of acetoin/glycerol metabolism